MDVIILAGGMGTRLKEVVTDVPKPMAPVKNKPFLEYLLRWLSQYRSIEKIILAVGYKSDIIIQYFGSSFNNIPLMYSNETEPLGTGGAILKALNLCESKNILIVNGDTYFPIDVSALERFHDKESGILSIALKTMRDFDRYGTVETEFSVITNFNEKRYCEEGLINGGIYILTKAWLEKGTYPSNFSFEKDVLENYVSEKNFRGKVFKDVFVDIGIPDDYARVEFIV